MKLLLGLIFTATLVTNSFANTEKLILEARADNVQEHCDAKLDLVSLTPPYTQTRQSLIPYSENIAGLTQKFRLEDLNDGSNYEIRISYPAIVRSILYLSFAI